MVREKNGRKLIVALAMVAAFAYGTLVGRYHVFPFQQLKAAKIMAVGQPANARAQAVREGRRRNFLNRVEMHRSYKSHPDVVMIGDSLTDFAEWSEMFPGVNIVNRGISGDSTRGVLERLDSITATGADIAFIMIGVNDIGPGTTAEAIYQDYEKIIDGLLASQIKPYIQSTLLVGEDRKEKNPVITALNSKLRELAARRNLVYIDLNARLAADGMLAARYASDAIHLNAEGYAIWKEMIAPVIANNSMVSHAAIRSPAAQLEKKN